METESLQEQAPPQGVMATAEIDKPGDTSTHFIFKHKVFSIANCRFAYNGSDKMPCFYIPMGDMVAAIELAKIQQEFGIDAGSVDAALLKKVEKGLNYVAEIKPNDSIPREILDGSASWTVEERHKDLAKGRLNMELIFWVNGFREDMPPLHEIMKRTSDQEGRNALKDAHKNIAQLLGLKDSKVSRDRIDAIARETTYIEALRERSGKIGEIAQKLASFSSVFKKETSFIAEIVRMQDLMRRAGKQVGEKFQKVDGGMKEVVKIATEYNAFIETVRQMRDDLHIELKKWDEYFPIWSELKIERNEESEKLFRKFYRFLAENYMEQQSWGSSMGNNKKK